MRQILIWSMRRLDEADLNELVNAPVTYFEVAMITSSHRPPKPGIFDLHLHRPDAR